MEWNTCEIMVLFDCFILILSKRQIKKEQLNEAKDNYFNHKFQKNS